MSAGEDPGTNLTPAEWPGRVLPPLEGEGLVSLDQRGVAPIKWTL